MIVDSPALLAVLLREPGHEAILDQLIAADAVRVGAPTLVETGMVLVARAGLVGKSLLARLLDEADAETVHFTEDHWLVAVDAFVRYGKGRHAAALNFGDCLTYAIARLSGESLLCVGDDFTRTDLSLVYVRRSARVLVLDPQFRVLLLKFQPEPSPDSAVWEVPGGGVAPGESVSAAAVRELAEETGLDVDRADLGSPIAYGSGYADLGWARGPLRDDYFTYQTEHTDIGHGNMTALETRHFVEARWWSTDELARTSEPVYPIGLADLIERLESGDRPREAVKLPWHHSPGSAS